MAPPCAENVHCRTPRLCEARNPPRTILGILPTYLPITKRNCTPDHAPLRAADASLPGLLLLIWPLQLRAREVNVCLDLHILCSWLVSGFNCSSYCSVQFRSQSLLSSALVCLSQLSAFPEHFLTFASSLLVRAISIFQVFLTTRCINRSLSWQPRPQRRHCK